MSERSLLSGSVRVFGGSDGKERIFQILPDGKVETGGSVICYEAQYGSSRRGTLKELYPLGNSAFIRSPDQLVIPIPKNHCAAEEFEEAVENYLRPYTLLMQLQKDPANRDLRTFLPDFELFRGQDETGGFNGTAYVWEPAPKVLTFREKCRQIRTSPDNVSEHDLILILKAVRSLADCVRALHTASLLHRDLTPGNFGFAVRNGEILTDSITLFDVNTLCTMDDACDVAQMGTPGYTEPAELLSGEESFPCIQTDIYSMGAILFHALAIPQPEDSAGSDSLCRPAYFTEIPDLLRKSPLLRAADTSPHLLPQLAEILQKCLCSRRERYEDCESLIEDLDKVLKLIVPAGDFDIRTADPGIWQKIGRELEKSRDKNAACILRYHLSRFPLYRWLDGSSRDLNILIIGCGQHGRTYLDLCLQAAQIPEINLSVTILADSPEDKLRYLSERPGLPGFFRIDGSEVKDSFGSIRFLVHPMSETDTAGNRKILQNIFRETPFRCVMIASGSDSLNRTLARDIRCLLPDLPDGAVSYITETTPGSAPPTEGTVPVFVNENIGDHPLNAFFDRMAFNAYLLWEKQLCLNFRTLYEKFQKKYNYNASVSMVLFLQYKLYSIARECGLFGGEDFGNADFASLDMWEIAEEFSDSGYRYSERYRKHRDILICYEHRRWVTEKICQGWQCMEDLRECTETGSTKNLKTSRHICILHSTPGQPLADRDYTFWDTAGEDEMTEAGLDELDILSVRLHQAYLAKSAVLRKENPLGILELIREEIRSDAASDRAFQEWYACFLGIMNDNAKKLRLYDSLKSAFLSAVKTAFPKDRYEAAEKQVQAFEARFQPIIRAKEYRDFKTEDAVIIERIPFILTYSHSIGLIVPFTPSDRNSVLFRSVSAATRINPEEISFLYHLEKAADSDLLCRSLESVLRYLEKKKLRAGLTLYITCPVSLADHAKESAECLRALSPRPAVRILPVSSKEEISDTLLKKLLKEADDGRILLAEINGSPLSFLLEGCGFFDRLSTSSPSCGFYSDDPERVRFRTNHKSSILRHLPPACITVSEMMSFRSCGSFCGNPPDFSASCSLLWEEYRKNPPAWKKLCAALRTHAEASDIIAEFPADRIEEDSSRTEYSYLFRAGCVPAVDTVISRLKEFGILLPESTIQSSSPLSCQAVLYCRGDFGDAFDSLFANPYILASADDIRVFSDGKSVKISFDNLMTSGFSMDAFGLGSEHYGILEFMHRHHFLNNLRKNGNSLSFTFASRSVRELLTDSRRILEIHTYHSCRETGVFDDVVSGFEPFRDTEHGISSENNRISCVLTRGFRSLFVECSSSRTISPDSYCRLSCLREKFGINASALLIAAGSDDSELNAGRREQGRMLNVITVTDRDEIDSIGETLANLLDSSLS